MNSAFEVTQDDLEIVMSKLKKLSSFSEEEIENIFDDLDLNLIEKAALYSTDMDEQTDFAHQEIENQLRKNGVL